MNFFLFLVEYICSRYCLLFHNQISDTSGGFFVSVLFFHLVVSIRIELNFVPVRRAKCDF